YHINLSEDPTGAILSDGPSLFEWVFFFSSRRRHTRSKRDWSSDVCSSDLWEAAVRSLGKEYGWEVLGVTKSGCVLQDGQKPETSMCQAWNDNFIDWVAENDIDMVITPGTRVVSTHSNESVTQGAPH